MSLQSNTCLLKCKDYLLFAKGQIRPDDGNLMVIGDANESFFEKEKITLMPPQ